ncbi:MAG: LL-diaminopimelate aminotransferase [Candidatus Aureabacteria bacterium]|nr:LL-diaminopimelate aminotransferase [Candidatus Auribacterota bacterium]
MSIEYSNRLKKLPPYLFVEVDKAKQGIVKQGKDVIDIGIGDPDMPTPKNIISVLQDQAENKANHQYPSNRGIGVLREEIAKWCKKRFSISLDSEKEILPLLGSKEGIGHIPVAFISSEEDVVLVSDPGYPVYNSGTILAGGTPYKMALLKENNFLPVLKDIPETIAKRAKLMHINYPNNPTSAVATEEFFKEVIEFAHKYNVIVCHDAAYTEISYDGYIAPSFLETDGAKDVGIEFHSLSKTFNMTGWRIAFAAGNEKVLDGLAKVKSNMDSGIFQAVQYAGIEALKLGSDFDEQRNAVYQERLDAFYNGLIDMGIKIDKPKATFYVWFPVPDGYTSKSFAMKVLREAHVVITPGNGFGEFGEGYVRAALTVDADRIKEATKRIKSIL